MNFRTSREFLVEDPPAPNVTEINVGSILASSTMEDSRFSPELRSLGGYTSKDTGT
jgi:hypothetical protein